LTPRIYPTSRSRPARVAKFPVNCELPHIGAPKNIGALFHQAQRDAEEMQMRIGIGIAVVLAIGLIWSVAAMSEWVPVVSAG
jgi:putative heme degradation protein